jgi:hypothetical protein
MRAVAPYERPKDVTRQGRHIMPGRTIVVLDCQVLFRLRGSVWLLAHGGVQRL